MKSRELGNQLTREQEQAVRQIIAGADHAFDYDEVVEGLKKHGWLVHPVYSGGVIAGGIIQKGAELHTSIAPEFQKKWNPRPYIKTVLYPALKQFGRITSLAAKNDSRCLCWLQKLGFSITGEDDDYYHLLLTEVKY